MKVQENQKEKLKEDLIYLRSLSVKYEINILMSGENHFYIFSRYAYKFGEYTTVCYISKKFQSARTFFSFGVFEKNKNFFSSI
jgi:hypothetical protein